MPSDKRTKKSSGKKEAAITDERFASFAVDPRYRLPSKKHTKTKLDSRFSRMLKDDEFTSTAKVDRYGRKVMAGNKKKALERLYDVDEAEKDDESRPDDSELGEIDDDEVQRELEAVGARYDPARDGGFSSSEDEEEEDEYDDEEGTMQQFVDQQAEAEEGDVTNRIAIVNLDWDHVKAVDLMALFQSFLPSNSPGKIDKVTVYPSEFGQERMQKEEIEGPPQEIFRNKAQVESLSDKKSKKTNSKVSDKKSKSKKEKTIEVASSDSESEDEEALDERIKEELLRQQRGEDTDFDSEALRTYQLERLRYFYAVMVCSDAPTAQKLYEATDGTEYLSSSNFLDLRFIPDDVTFDEKPRDECTEVPEKYRPVEFVTNALQSSKVKLTWDMHPEEAARKEVLRKAFSGSREELEEQDIRAYLASDSDSDDEAAIEVVDASHPETENLSKKELSRRKLREALGLGDEIAGKRSSGAPVGDMEITFTPALTEAEQKRAKAQEAGEEETTLEKYMRKERERKDRKRLLKQEEEGARENGAVAEDDLGFNDPFFTLDPSQPASSSTTTKTQQRKEERLQKRREREEAEASTASEKAKLKQILSEEAAETGSSRLNHFDMNDVVRTEKLAKAKGKKSKKKLQAKLDAQGGGEVQENFAVDVKDARFSAVFDSHEYAIDPSDARFKGTEGMKAILEEGRRKRKHRSEAVEEDDHSHKEKSKKKKSKSDRGEKSPEGDADVAALVERVKRKSKNKVL